MRWARLTGIDGSGMVPHPIEIAQNGLGDPPARGRAQRESISEFRMVSELQSCDESPESRTN